MSVKLFAYVRTSSRPQNSVSHRRWSRTWRRPREPTGSLASVMCGVVTGLSVHACGRRVAVELEGVERPVHGCNDVRGRFEVAKERRVAFHV